jgi:hypothetical protein
MLSASGYQHHVSALNSDKIVAVVNANRNVGVDRGCLIPIHGISPQFCPSSQFLQSTITCDVRKFPKLEIGDAELLLTIDITDADCTIYASIRPNVSDIVITAISTIPDCVAALNEFGWSSTGAVDILILGQEIDLGRIPANRRPLRDFRDRVEQLL